MNFYDNFAIRFYNTTPGLIITYYNDKNINKVLKLSRGYLRSLLNFNSCLHLTLNAISSVNDFLLIRIENF